MKVLLTGGSGFIGSRIAGTMDELNCFDLQLPVRRNSPQLPGSCVYLPSIGPSTNWVPLLTGVEVVIHAAARAHVPSDRVTDELSEFRQLNVQGTVNLAMQAANAGVNRFIFISTVGVNGNINIRPFNESDTPKPADSYSLSKLEAETSLWEIARETGMEVVIIRPPLVYGPKAPGNFGRLVSSVERGVPLPLGSIHNLRSFVGLDNLVDLVITCIDHPAAANEVFLAGDGQDISTSELIRGIAEAMGKPARLIAVPSSLLMIAGTLLGKRSIAERLLGSLQVDISKASRLLGWTPQVSVHEGLRRCFEPDV